MAAEGNPVCGSVMLLHTGREGKHSYEVNGFFNYNKGKFASKGDKVIMINNRDVEDLTPQAFAELLVEGSHLLTIHHSPKRKTGECESEEINVLKKEPTVMRFSMMMVREEELEATEVQPSPEWEDKDIEDDCFIDDDVLHSLANMSLNLMVDQDSDADNPFCNCDRQLDESQIMAETADIAYISAQIWKVIKEQSNSFLKTHNGCKYVASKQNKICLEKTMSAKITIFLGTFLGIRDRESGVPVVLNFTDTDNFLCCTEEKILSIKVYDKKKISADDLSADDPEKLSLIFYMSQKCDGLRYFESVLHRGWFIHTVNDDVVKMKEGNNTSSSCFVLE